ncbi:MAG: hypothetical protein ACOY33_02640 [Pseudomonadota bacterium]
MSNERQPGAPDDFPPDDDSAVRVRALYRGLPAAEPPAELDERILAAARRAARSRPQAVPWTVRWRAPLATAACLLLVIGVLWRLPAPQHGALQEAVREESAVADAAPAPIATAPAADALPARTPPAGEPEMKPVAPAETRITGSAAPVAVAGAPAKAEAVAGPDPAMADAVAPAEMPPAAAPAPVAAMAEDELREHEALAAAAERSSTPTALRDGLAKSAAPAAQQALAPRGAPWPYGLVPTLAPATACARLVQESGGSCSARLAGGALELRLSGHDPEWLPRLAAALAELGWQPEFAGAEGARHVRLTEAGRERIEWSLKSGGVLSLRLVAADGTR